MNKSSFLHLNTKIWRTIAVCLVFVLCLYMVIDATLAWFYEQSGTNKILIIGNVDLDVTINDNFADNVVAPKAIYTNMPTTIKLSEKHTTQTALIRVKFTTNSDKFALYGVDTTKWISNVESGETYYYYMGLLSSDEITFNTGYHMVGNVTNADVGSNINYTFTIYGLQSQYKAYQSEWANAPSAWMTWANSNT